VASLDAIVEDLKALPPDKLEQAASYIRILAHPQLTKGSDLRDLAGIWTDEEADEVLRVIEEHCERIEPMSYDDSSGH